MEAEHRCQAGADEAVSRASVEQDSDAAQTRCGPCAVQGNLESCGLNVGLLRCHTRNLGTLVSVAARAGRACHATAKPSVEA